MNGPDPEGASVGQPARRQIFKTRKPDADDSICLCWANHSNSRSIGFGLCGGGAMGRARNTLGLNAVVVFLVGTVIVLAQGKPELFADGQLESAVRSVLPEAKGQLTEQLLANVHILEAKNRSIRSLAGLEKCRNLSLLNLAHNQVESLAPLAGLEKLQSLDLSHNRISDLTPLAKVPALQYLNLTGNQISDLRPLASLTSLSALYLANNQIRDISPLAGLPKLVTLDISRNQVTDLGPISKLTRLNTLNASDNAISDIKAVADLPELRLLILERNRIEHLTPLVEACRKDAAGPRRIVPFLRVYLAGNPLSATGKQQIAELRQLGVRVESE